MNVLAFTCISNLAIELNFHASRIMRLMSSITGISSVLRQGLAIYFLIV